MKRLLSVLLVLALLIPLSAFAVSDSDVVGCWANYSVSKDGTPTMTMLYLAEDYTCYYIIQDFHHDEAGLGRVYVGTWNIQSDGTIYAKTGNNTETVLTLYSEYVALNKKTMDVFVNITSFTLQ